MVSAGAETPKPAVYERGQRLAQCLGDHAMQASRVAWEVEHAVRDVRLAETDKEKSEAVAALTRLVDSYDAFSAAAE